MLYWLLYSLESSYSFFNVFRYITFRSGMAAVTAFLFVIIAGKPFIEWIRRRQYGQAVRDDGPQTHLKKKGTPTMGGLLIIGGMSLGTLLWADLSNANVWFLLVITWIYAGIGFLDDYFKVLRKDPRGLASRWKFRLQVIGALIVSIGLYKAQTGWEA